MVRLGLNCSRAEENPPTEAGLDSTGVEKGFVFGLPALESVSSKETMEDVPRSIFMDVSYNTDEMRRATTLSCIEYEVPLLLKLTDLSTFQCLWQIITTCRPRE